MAAQRNIQSNGLNDPMTVSLAVDAVSRSNVSHRSPGRAWPSEKDIRQRQMNRTDDIRLSPAAYTLDVSHLVV